jgi:hypothetical protein
LSILTEREKNEVWRKIPALMTDLASENHNPALKVAQHIQSPDIPGMPCCNLHTCLGWDRDLPVFHEELERAIGEEKLKARLKEKTTCQLKQEIWY